jgi:hypothetical protein
MVPFSFKQIESGLIGFISNLELKLQKIVPQLPVFVLQTGDGSYFLDKKFTETDNKEIYQKVPRFIITIDDIQYQTEQNSNKYNKFVYLFNEANYLSVGRRLAILISVQTDFVSANFIKALENFEIMSTIISNENVFTYEFLGNTYEGSFNISAPSLEKPGMEPNSATRNFSVKTQLELFLQLLVPRIESIKLLSESGFESVQYDIHSKIDDKDSNFSQIIVTKED